QRRKIKGAKLVRNSQRSSLVAANKSASLFAEHSRLLRVSEQLTNRNDKITRSLNLHQRSCGQEVGRNRCKVLHVPSDDDGAGRRRRFQNVVPAAGCNRAPDKYHLRARIELRELPDRVQEQYAWKRHFAPCIAP